MPFCGLGNRGRQDSTMALRCIGLGLSRLCCRHQDRPWQSHSNSGGPDLRTPSRVSLWMGYLEPKLLGAGAFFVQHQVQTQPPQLRVTRGYDHHAREDTFYTPFGTYVPHFAVSTGASRRLLIRRQKSIYPNRAAP